MIMNISPMILSLFSPELCSSTNTFVKSIATLGKWVWLVLEGTSLSSPLFLKAMWRRTTPFPVHSHDYRKWRRGWRLCTRNRSATSHT